MSSGQRLLAPLCFLSGAAGIGYQLIWTKLFAAGLGHEMISLVAVISAFFAGLAAGGWTLGRRVQATANPSRFFGALEVVIGGWAFLSAFLIPLANQLALQLLGLQPTWVWQALVTFVLPFLMLLPATLAMGATLPAMDRWFATFTTDGRCLGAVYALNTAGAVAGVLGTAFFLMPVLGLRGSTWALAGLNLFCGTVALLSRPTATRKSTPSPAPPVEPLSSRRVNVTLFFTGLFGIGFEVGGIRALAQVLEGTLYTFAATLSIYLLGTAIGAMLLQKFGRGRPGTRLLGILLSLLVVAGVAGVWGMATAPTLYDWSRDMLGDSLGAVMLSEMVAATVVFGPPTVCMGAVFSHLAQSASRQAGGIGRAAALNTLGATLAGGLFGLVLIPAVGTKWSLLIASFGPALLLPRIGLRQCLGLLPLVALALALPARFDFLKLPPDASLLAFREGAMGTVAVIQTPDGHRALRVNNRFQMGGTAAALAERRQAHLPLLLHPAPQHALFLGPGTGITLGAASHYPGLIADGVELLPEVIEMIRYFEPENEGPLPKPGIQLFQADARRFVQTPGTRYDVIVADLFHPGQDGAGFLYTREHFEAIRRRLRPGGLFCQWLPLHQMDEATLRIIIRTFTSVYSQTRAFLLQFNVDIPALGLVGTLEPLALPPHWLEQRSAGAASAASLKNAGFDRTINLFGCLAAGPKALEQFAGDAPMATDNHPRVTFTAPRFVTRRDRHSHELLMQFLDRAQASPADILLDPASDATRAFASALADYFAARDRYLHGLVLEGDGHLAGAIDAYLASAGRSLYFTPAYARCVGIVQMLATTDKAAARQLFDRLEKAQPAQPLGKKMLGPLFDGQ